MTLLVPTITVAALARAAKVSRETVYWHIRRGHLRRQKNGTILHSEGIRWIEWRKKV
jgi:hypothetical protein